MVVVVAVAPAASLMEGSRPVWVDTLQNLLSTGAVAGEDFLGVPASDASQEGNGAGHADDARVWKLLVSKGGLRKTESRLDGEHPE